MRLLLISSRLHGSYHPYFTTIMHFQVDDVNRDIVHIFVSFELLIHRGNGGGMTTGR